MRWPRVEYVASPDLNAEILFDFNDDLVECYPDAESFSLGVPELSGDPDGIGVEYGLRSIEFSLIVRAGKADALAKQSALARQMMRRTGWLQVQLQETADPVWFQTWRAEPGDLEFSQVYTDSGEARKDTWAIAVTIPAEPFAVGEPVTFAAQTVNLDPSAATAPARLTLPAQPGDALTPLRLDVTWSATRDGYRSLVAASVGEAAPVVWPVGSDDSWTPGPATAAGASKAAASGGSSRAFAASTADQTVVSGTMPALTAGSYKVLARVIRGTADGEFSLRLHTLARGGTIVAASGPEVATAWGASAAGYATWLDLGEFTFPAGQEVPAGTQVAPTVRLDARRTSGTDGFDLDAFLLVPVGQDDRCLFVDRGYGPATGATERIDGEAGAVTYWTGTTPNSTLAPATAGGFPQMQPGEPTLLTFLSQVDAGAARFNGVDTPDVVAETASVVVSYRPRWLYIGGGQ